MRQEAVANEPGTGEKKKKKLILKGRARQLIDIGTGHTKMNESIKIFDGETSFMEFTMTLDDSLHSCNLFKGVDVLGVIP